MIVAGIKDAAIENYKRVHERFPAAFEALKKLIAEDADPGNYEIDGKNIYAMVLEYETEPEEKKSFEIHKDYIDIQYIISGSELMGYESLDKLAPTGDYKPDIQFFTKSKDFDRVILNFGELAVFFPYEAHAPGIAVDNSSALIKKIVVKVLA